MENPINMDDLGVPLFLETPISLTFSFSQNNSWLGGGFKYLLFSPLPARRAPRYNSYSLINGLELFHPTYYPPKV